MRIAMLTFGSMGDVAPVLALSQGLQRAGHQILFASHAIFAPLAARYGLPFYSFGENLKDMVQRVGNRPLARKIRYLPSRFTAMPGTLMICGPMLQRLWTEFSRIAPTVDAVGLTGVNALISSSLAETIGCSCFAVQLVPCISTRAFPNPFLPGMPSPLPGYNRFSHFLTRSGLSLILGGRVSRLRARLLAERQLNGDFSPRKTPVLVGVSPTIVPAPDDWPPSTRLVGYWWLDPPAGWTPPPDLLRFLEKGSPPLAIGFGSMMPNNPERITAIIKEALRRTSQRAILLSGWGALRGTTSESLYFAESLPHGWLYPRVTAAIHHSGAGATAASLRAGLPTIAIPYIGDQFFWADRIHALGTGPRPIPVDRLSVKRLVGAIGEALGNPSLRHRASAISAQLGAEDGVSRALELLAEFIPGFSRHPRPHPESDRC